MSSITSQFDPDLSRVCPNQINSISKSNSNSNSPNSAKSQESPHAKSQETLLISIQTFYEPINKVARKPLLKERLLSLLNKVETDSEELACLVEYMERNGTLYEIFQDDQGRAKLQLYRQRLWCGSSLEGRIRKLEAEVIGQVGLDIYGVWGISGRRFAKNTFAVVRSILRGIERALDPSSSQSQSSTPRAGGYDGWEITKGRRDKLVELVREYCQMKGWNGEMDVQERELESGFATGPGMKSFHEWLMTHHWWLDSTSYPRLGNSKKRKLLMSTVTTRAKGKAKRILDGKRRKVANKSLYVSSTSSVPATPSSSISLEAKIFSDSEVHEEDDENLDDIEYPRSNRDVENRFSMDMEDYGDDTMFDGGSEAGDIVGADVEGRGKQQRRKALDRTIEGNLLSTSIQYESEKSKTQTLHNRNHPKGSARPALEILGDKEQNSRFNLDRSSPTPAIGFGSGHGGRLYNGRHHDGGSDQRFIESIERGFTLEDEEEDDDDNDDEGEEGEEGGGEDEDEESVQGNNGQRVMSRNKDIERMRYNEGNGDDDGGDDDDQEDDDKDEDGRIGSEKDDVTEFGEAEEDLQLGQTMDSEEGEGEITFKSAGTMNMDTFSNADDNQREIFESSTALLSSHSASIPISSLDIRGVDSNTVLKEHHRLFVQRMNKLWNKQASLLKKIWECDGKIFKTKAAVEVAKKELEKWKRVGRECLESFDQLGLDLGLENTNADVGDDVWENVKNGMREAAYRGRVRMKELDELMKERREFEERWRVIERWMVRGDGFEFEEEGNVNDGNGEGNDESGSDGVER
ncbi:hypothetical protein EAF00_012026 [Botryotinia globosa]|nr:hypothetical protein EAF00_012026 [Botryotinia globosa]